MGSFFNLNKSIRLLEIRIAHHLDLNYGFKILIRDLDLNRPRLDSVYIEHLSLGH